MKDKLSHLVEHWERHYLYGGAMEYMQCANELRATLDADGDSGADEMAVQSARERVEMALREPNSAKAAQVASELGAAHRVTNPPAQPTKLEDAVRDVVADVLAELSRAMLKFPTWPTDPLHALGVVNEEVGEMAKAVLQQVYEPHKNKPDDVRKEAIQAAAMTLRFIASLPTYQFTPGIQHDQPMLTAAIQENAK